MHAMDAPEARLLVVDGEPTLRALLADALRYAGFHVTSAACGADALTAVVRDRPDLVVLDVALPDVSGLAVVRRLREDGGRSAHGRLPVLFLSARDTVADRLSGLAAGADDYVAKPFSLDELIARIRALLRRAGRCPAEGGRLVAGDLELDLAGRRVTRGGRVIRLSPTEFRLLAYLMANAGRVLAKEQILHHVWPPEFAGSTDIVESYVSYLRHKLSPPGTPPLIHTLRTRGYTLRAG